MNGIENIIARIDDDARQESQAILEQARTQAQAILEEYRAQARREAEAILERGRTAAAQQGQRLDSAAQLEGRKALLAAKQELIQAAFDRALEKLRGLPREEYISLLADLAAKASSTGREKLIFSQTDRAAVGKAVVMAANQRLGDGALTLSEECRNMEGGFVLSGGAVEVNCSFEALLRQARAPLTAPVTAVLFP